VSACPAQLDQATTELEALKPDVIVTAAGTPGALAAQRATRTIPIVFETVRDPVRSGLVASLPRPGGNLTGTVLFTNTLDAKRAQILVAALGKPTMLAVLDMRRTEAQRQFAMEGWPVFPGTRMQVFEAERSEDLPALFERMVQQKASGLGSCTRLSPGSTRGSSSNWQPSTGCRPLPMVATMPRPV
jgi:putative ABC transport system substrate-binding protein